MLARFISIVAMLFFVAACNTTSSTQGGAGFSADKNAAQSETLSAANRFDIASGNLEPFTPIDGSSIGAKASDRVFFSFDSASLNAQARKTLDKQVAWLKKNSDASVTIEGHCDERGTREYNLALGDRRAMAVKNYLVNSGVSESRVGTISYGKERPAVLGSNEAAWAENRRSVTTLN